MFRCYDESCTSWCFMFFREPVHTQWLTHTFIFVLVEPSNSPVAVDGSLANSPSFHPYYYIWTVNITLLFLFALHLDCHAILFPDSSCTVEYSSERGWEPCKLSFVAVFILLDSDVTQFSWFMLVLLAREFTHDLFF